MPTSARAGHELHGAPVRGRSEAAAEGLREAPRRGAAPAPFKGPSSSRRTVKRVAGPADVMMLTHDLSMLLGAGIPLMQALEAIEEQAPDGRLREVMRGAAREISEGRKFSEALARHPDLFSSAYRGIVGNGELTGRLDLALERLAAFLQRDLEVRQKIRDMLIYPALVLVMAGVVLTIFLMFIIPAFDRVYRTAGATLPLLTRILVVWSRAFRAGLPLLAAAVAAAAFPPVRQRLWAVLAGPVQSALLRIPHAEDLTRSMLQSRFAHSMAMMLQSGVPVLTALEVTGQMGGPLQFGPVVAALRRSISNGRRFTDAMRDTRWFFPMFVR
ncbi:MAG: type II secretion system F family protein, partial [Bacillati bacterium ANGP1]